ncbi:MAG: tetraacyldisaccharide 4'-kinase, partial [Nitrospinota bacterium]
NSLKEAGIEIMGFSAFDDHYQFRSEDMDSLIAKARETGSEILITTEKDFVRLLELGDISFPIWILKIGMDVFEGREILMAKIRDAIKSYI